MFPKRLGKLKILVFFLFALLISLISLHAISNSSFAQKYRTLDLALVMAVDCSFSVDAKEFQLQMQGIAGALSSAEVVEAIVNSRSGIAISLVQWAGSNTQKVAIPWQILLDENSVHNLAQEIATSSRMVTGKTSISAIIDFGAHLISILDASANRHVIDISADGVNNNGALPKSARERAISAGITINGLTIINEVEALDTYFEKYITGGVGHFVEVANDYHSYQSAIKRKLLREIQGNNLM